MEGGISAVQDLCFGKVPWGFFCLLLRSRLGKGFFFKSVKSLWVFHKESRSGEGIYYALRAESAETCNTSQSWGVYCQASGPHNDVTFCQRPGSPSSSSCSGNLLDTVLGLSVASLEMWTRTLIPEEEGV